jgi:hypothetical protein
MSGCALFSATIKDSDRCWILLGREWRWHSRIAGNSAGACDYAGHLRVCTSGTLENYVGCLAGTLIREPAIYG